MTIKPEPVWIQFASVDDVNNLFSCFVIAKRTPRGFEWVAPHWLIDWAENAQASASNDS